MEIEIFNNIEKKYNHELLNSIAEIQQARSNFQIDHFVVGQHDTLEMQYYQTLIELQQLYYTIRVANLQIKKTKIEINKLKSTNDEIDNIDAEIREIELEQLMVAAKGTVREIERLLEIYNSFEHKYTREEIESGQEKYWNLRLQRQAVLEIMANGSTAQAAHLDSLRQIGAIKFDENGNIIVKENIPLNEIDGNPQSMLQ